MTSLRARCCSFWANPNSPSPPSNAMVSDCRMHRNLFALTPTQGHARLASTRPSKFSQDGSVWLITGNKIAGRTSVSPPRNAVRTLSPANELLLRIETTQCLQGRSCLSGRRAMSASTEQRKLAAIMFTDMVGYSALSQRDDKLALELLEEHRELLREIFPRFNGTEIKTIGDGFLVEFNSALEAAQCAIEIQRALSKRNHDVPVERRIEVRIGVHIGDVVHRGGDVYGDGVNIASRIEALAGAGGICVSMDVERQIRNALDARFERLAPTELKHISVPMDLFRIVLPWEKKSDVRGQKAEVRGGATTRRMPWHEVVLAVLLILGLITGGFFFLRHRASQQATNAAASSPVGSVPEKSLAVLPFENLSEEKANAFFTEGVQDEILTNLSRIADLKVISRTSVMQYKTGAARNLREIGQQLGVAHVVEGSVQRAANKVRVNAQLIDARNDAHLWAQTYDRDLADV